MQETSYFWMAASWPSDNSIGESDPPFERARAHSRQPHEEGLLVVGSERMGTIFAGAVQSIDLYRMLDQRGGQGTPEFIDWSLTN